MEAEVEAALARRRRKSKRGRVLDTTRLATAVEGLQFALTEALPSPGRRVKSKRRDDSPAWHAEQARLEREWKNQHRDVAPWYKRLQHK